MAKKDYLFYMVDIDIYNEEYGVIETVEDDLFRSKSFSAAKKFAKEFAKNKDNFDFNYLHKHKNVCYQMTIRKYYKKPTETENGEWDDEDIVEVKEN